MSGPETPARAVTDSATTVRQKERVVTDLREYGVHVDADRVRWMYLEDLRLLLRACRASESRRRGD